MTTTAHTFPLRVSRTTTGVVHAARERRVEIFDYSKPVEERGTGKYRTVTVKACGAEPNTGRRIAGTESVAVPVTCKKCLKAIS